MAAESIRLEGGKEIEQRLRRLPSLVERKVVRQSLRAGAKVVQAQAVSDAPKKTGFLSRNIKVRAARRSRGRIGVVVQTDKGFFKGDAFYGAFQEMGFHIGPRRLGDSRRFVEGKHFMKRAFDSTKQRAADVTLESLKVGIEREASA